MKILEGFRKKVEKNSDPAKAVVRDEIKNRMKMSKQREDGKGTLYLRGDAGSLENEYDPAICTLLAICSPLCEALAEANIVKFRSSLYRTLYTNHAKTACYLDGVGSLINCTSYPAKSVSSSRRYSPVSACRKHTMAVGSSCFACAALLAVAPKPRGTSSILQITTS
jgi:hypothetical protein